MTVTPLKEFVGYVIEISPKHKAIVRFQLDNKPERALLWYDKLKINGVALPEEGSIEDYLEVNSCVKFLCHPFDDSGVDRCSWYITSAWPFDAKYLDMSNGEIILSGLYNYTGRVVEIARRQGILSFTLNGKEENVLFLGSKLFMMGKRVPAKTNLTQIPALEEGRTLEFDAVPCDPVDGGHNWFATAVWKGNKPNMEYDSTPSKNLSLQMEMKMLSSNPHSMFLRATGQVMSIMCSEYGIAIAAIKNNHYETVLFHCSNVMLFDRNLANDDLRTIFQEGDKIRLVAAAAGTRKIGTKWAASQVRVVMDPSLSHKFPQLS